jgi:hypothetical protein
MCRVEAYASHSYGGGGPGQAVINRYAYAVNCYNAEGGLHWQTPHGQYTGGGVGIHRQDCGTQQDIWIDTAYNDASNHFIKCLANYNGQEARGEENDHIDSGIVSVSSSTCTYYFPCA